MSEEKTCKTCIHFLQTTKPKLSWLDRVEQAQKTYLKMSQEAATTLADNEDLWEQEDSGRGFCAEKVVDEQIPSHMSCFFHKT